MDVAPSPIYSEGCWTDQQATSLPVTLDKLIYQYKLMVIAKRSKVKESAHKTHTKIVYQLIKLGKAQFIESLIISPKTKVGLATITKRSASMKFAQVNSVKRSSLLE